jgi:hypothetical protein
MREQTNWEQAQEIIAIATQADCDAIELEIATDNDPDVIGAMRIEVTE